MNKRTSGKWNKKVEKAELIASRIGALQFSIGALEGVRFMLMKQLEPLVKELKQARKNGIFKSEEKKK